MLGNDNSITPIQMKEELQLKAIGNAVIDAGPASPNLLLYIGPGSGGGFIPGPVDDGALIPLPPPPPPAHSHIIRGYLCSFPIT